MWQSQVEIKGYSVEVKIEFNADTVTSGLLRQDRDEGHVVHVHTKLYLACLCVLSCETRTLECTT